MTTLAIIFLCTTILLWIGNGLITYYIINHSRCNKYLKFQYKKRALIINSILGPLTMIFMNKSIKNIEKEIVEDIIKKTENNACDQ